jgi:hypothetical protein
MKRAICLAAAFAVLGTPALAQQGVTVKALLAKGYAVVGTVPSPIGPGVFLALPNSLYLCFVSETPDSPTVATRYCKPVQ